MNEKIPPPPSGSEHLTEEELKTLNNRRFSKFAQAIIEDSVRQRDLAVCVAIVGKVRGGPHLSVELADGRVIQTPLQWYPKLVDATDEQLANYQLIGGGIGVRWPDLDEDLSVEAMLAGRRSSSAAR